METESKERMRALQMVHDTDPKEDIFTKLRGLEDKLSVFGNFVLVAVYVRPTMTKSGIILADNTRKEDVYQGKVGLVLKKGPTAFVSDDRYDFKGQDVARGDWVGFRVSDGWQLKLGDVDVRMLQDVDIKFTVDEPDILI